MDLGKNVGYLPLWAGTLGVSTVCGAALFAVTDYRAPPERWNLSLGLAFGTSIVWISCAATELLECLTTLGAAMVGDKGGGSHHTARFLFIFF